MREIEYFIEAYDAEGNGPARFGAPNLALKLQLKPPLSASTTKPPAPKATTDSSEGAEVALHEPSGPSTWREPVAYALLGVGVLLAGGGAFELGSHRSAANEFNSRFDREGFYDATKRTEIESQGKLGSGLLGAGLAAAAAGSVFLVLEF